MRVRIRFAILKSLVPGAWIPYKNDHVWVEFKYGRLLKFCYYYGLLTHQSRFCEGANDVCIDFGGKYAQFG